MARGWEIEEVSPGTFDVSYNGRSVRRDEYGVDDAMRTVRRLNERDGYGETEVTIIEPDGYRTTQRL